MARFTGLFKYCAICLTLLFVVGCDNPVVKSSQPAVLKSPPENAEATKSDSGWYINQYCASNQQSWKPESQAALDLPGGVYELTRYPNQKPSNEELEIAHEMADKAWQVAKEKGWLLKEKARAEGYELMFEDNIHYVNKEYAYDGEELNPARPEFLMYYPTEHGDLLMGIMFLTEGRGEQFAGPLSIWHYHIGPDMCYEKGLLPLSYPDKRGGCQQGLVSKKTAEMIHVWFFKHPHGVLATTMFLDNKQYQVAIEEVLARYKDAGIIR